MRINHLVSLVVLLAGVASAADENPCADPKTQLDLNFCAGVRAAQAEAELKAALEALLTANKGDPAAIASLKSSQRAWLAFRDAELESLFPLGPKETARVKYGSIYLTCFAQAKEALTRTRAEQLKKRANRAEGDVCP